MRGICSGLRGDKELSGTAEAEEVHAHRAARAAGAGRGEQHPGVGDDQAPSLAEHCGVTGSGTVTGRVM